MSRPGPQKGGGGLRCGVGGGGCSRDWTGVGRCRVYTGPLWRCMRCSGGLSPRDICPLRLDRVGIAGGALAVSAHATYAPSAAGTRLECIRRKLFNLPFSASASASASIRAVRLWGTRTRPRAANARSRTWPALTAATRWGTTWCSHARAASRPATTGTSGCSTAGKSLTAFADVILPIPTKPPYATASQPHRSSVFLKTVAAYSTLGLFWHALAVHFEAQSYDVWSRVWLAAPALRRSVRASERPNHKRTAHLTWASIPSAATDLMVEKRPESHAHTYAPVECIR